jgi:hypothetical protein
LVVLRLWVTGHFDTVHRKLLFQVDHRSYDEIAVGGTIQLMPKRDLPASRRRGMPRLGRKTFVYFTDDERKLIDHAAKVERRSISSFVATAAIAAAEDLVNPGHKR